MDEVDDEMSMGRWSAAGGIRHGSGFIVLFVVFAVLVGCYSLSEHLLFVPRSSQDLSIPGWDVRLMFANYRGLLNATMTPADSTVYYFKLTVWAARGEKQVPFGLDSALLFSYKTESGIVHPGGPRRI